MTRDRGYPDWLVLSARLLWAGYHSAKYICLLTFPCGYVKILQPVAICTIIFVTVLGFMQVRLVLQEWKYCWQYVPNPQPIASIVAAFQQPLLGDG